MKNVGTMPLPRRMEIPPMPRRVEIRPTPQEMLGGVKPQPSTEAAPIERAFSFLESKLDEVENRAARLSQRISPVLCVGPESESTTKPLPDGSQVQSRLVRAAQRLEELSLILGALEQSCEL